MAAKQHKIFQMLYKITFKLISRQKIFCSARGERYNSGLSRPTHSGKNFETVDLSSDAGDLSPFTFWGTWNSLGRKNLAQSQRVNAET